MDLSSGELLEAGYVGTQDAVVQIRELIGDPHSGQGGRAYAFSLAGGLSFEVLPERGLDIGAVWFRDKPVAWRSALGSPGPGVTADGWIGRFGGGILVTCGLDNVGPARGKHSQHGSHHDTRAHDVTATRIQDHGVWGVRVTGTVDSVEIFGRRVRLHREITALTDRHEICVNDRITNEGSSASPVEVLYHVNLGAPLVLPGSVIDVPARVHELGSASIDVEGHDRFPQPTDTIGEAVWWHRELEPDQEGIATVRVTSPEGMSALVCWRVAELPGLVQWVFPTRGGWALGIEPTNSPLSQEERGAGGVQVLAPGQSINASLTIRFVQEKTT